MTREHVVVAASLSTLTPVPVPDDVRAVLERHLARGQAALDDSTGG